MKDFWLSLIRSKKLLSAVFVCFLAQTAEARIYIQIDQPSEKKFPIAVVNLLPLDKKESKDWSRKVPEIIRRDLDLTGLFDLIPEDQFPNNPGSRLINPALIQFPPWTLIGAQALVNGGYSFSQGQVRVELHLYDPFLGQHLLSRNYVAKEKEMTVVAHHFAEEIMQELTGERGVFTTKIAFVSNASKKKEIYVMDMDGSNIRQLTKEKLIALSPAWSPGGDLIAYTTIRKDGSAEVSTVPSGGGSPDRVTDNGSINVSPTWTKSGLLTIASALSGDTELYLMSLKGTIVRRLTNTFGIDVNPSWSPDGSQFVFASERAGRLHLFKSNANGGVVERLTFVGVQNDNPVWSPRGDRIVFQSLDEGWDLFIMNTDGSMLQRLTSEGQNESPSWAPNGRFIAFSSNRAGGSKIYIMREDGSHQTLIGGTGNATQPTWGPWFK